MLKLTVIQNVMTSWVKHTWFIDVQIIVSVRLKNPHRHGVKDSDRLELNKSCGIFGHGSPS